METNVCQNIERAAQMFTWNFGIITRFFLAGEGIQISTYTFDKLFYLVTGIITAALERHVLHEMSNALGLRSFVTATHAKPNTDGYTVTVFQSLSNNL